MRNVLSSVGVLMISVALLAGCSETDKPSEPVSTTEQTSTPESTAAEIDVAAAVEVAPLVVEITAHVSLRSDRRLMVEGESKFVEKFPFLGEV